MNQKHEKKSGVYRFKRFAHKTYSAFNSMHRVVNIGVLTACILTFAHASVASAQSVGTDTTQQVSEKELDEVTVTASRVELSLNQASKLVTVITKDEINRAAIQSIQDLLNYAEGVDVIQRGGRGVQADISIRGGTFDQTAILLNGINLSNPQTGHYSFDIPVNLSDIERIEIIHGPASIIYGASAFSGGINIITKKQPDSKAYLNVEGGSHNSYDLEAHGAITSKHLTNQLSVGYNSSDGYINNSDYQILNSLWQTRLKVDHSTVDFQLGYNKKNYGANTFYSPKYPNQYEKTDSYFASLQGQTGTILKFIPKIYWSRHYDCYQLFRDETPDIPTWYTGSNNHRSDVYGANLNLQYTSKLGITSLGAEFRNEGILSNVLGKPLDVPQGKYAFADNRTNISYALEHDILLKKFTFTFGLLANYNTALPQTGYKLYPSINASYRISKELNIYTSWNKATRMPTFTDMYYSGPTTQGDSNLLPEYSEAYELGFKYRNHFVNAYITAYSMKGQNMIDWVKDTEADTKYRAVNLSTVDRRGLEIGAKFKLNEILPVFAPITSLQLGYTRQYQTHNSEQFISNYVLNYLRDKFTAQFNHQIYKNITANWSFRLQKRMGTYEKYENLEKVGDEPYPMFSTLDVKVNWKLKDFNINMSVNNLYNTHYYDIGNIPQAGFWLMLGANYTFK